MIGRLESSGLRCRSLQWSRRSYAIFPLPTADGRKHRGKQTEAKEQEGEDHGTLCWDARLISNGSTAHDAHHGIDWFFSSRQSLCKMRAGHSGECKPTELYATFSAADVGGKCRRTVLLSSGFCLDAVPAGVKHTIGDAITQPRKIIVLHAKSVPVPDSVDWLSLSITRHPIGVWFARLWSNEPFHQFCPNHQLGTTLSFSPRRPDYESRRRTKKDWGENAEHRKSGRWSYCCQSWKKPRLIMLETRRASFICSLASTLLLLPITLIYFCVLSYLPKLNIVCVEFLSKLMRIFLLVYFHRSIYDTEGMLVFNAQ